MSDILEQLNAAEPCEADLALMDSAREEIERLRAVLRQRDEQRKQAIDSLPLALCAKEAQCPSDLGGIGPSWGRRAGRCVGLENGPPVCVDTA